MSNANQTNSISSIEWLIVIFIRLDGSMYQDCWNHPTITVLRKDTLLIFPLPD